MSVAVRVAFVGHGTPAQIAAAAPDPRETLTSWTPMAAAPDAVPLPSPPSVTAWAGALADLATAQVLYLAPGHGPDDDPGVPVLRELEDRRIANLTVGPESAPAVRGPALMGPASIDWQPSPGMQTVVRGVTNDREMKSWRSRLLAAYGSDAVMEVRSWSCSEWRAYRSAKPAAFPASLRALPSEQSRLRDTTTLLDIARRLRGPDGCPWDKRQTHQSLRAYLVEEAHEALAAIDQGDDTAMADEFGDVLLNLVLQAEIARQRGGFAWPDVVAAIGAKMIRRHPHVFGDARFEELEALGQTWAQIKASEHDEERGPLGGLPDSLPSLAFAHAAVRAPRRAGHPLDEADAEAAVMAAMAAGDNSNALGDALLWVAARADSMEIDLDMALRDANARLRERLRASANPA